MNRNVFILLLSLLFSCATFAQGTEKSDLQQRAETADQSKNVPQARSLYIHAFNDYISKGQTTAGVECAVRATALYYKDNLYKEAFELLRHVDQTIQSDKQLGDNKKAGLFYLSTKERMQMYLKLKKGESTKEQLNKMEILATRSADDATKNDLLYAKAIYYYTVGMNAQGNAVFKEMADKLTAAKDYDKVDEVYKTLIANGRRSNNASMVAQSYSNYIAWKDSTDAMKHADEINALKKQIADNEASIADKDSSLTTRMAVIISLCILAGALAVALVVGAIMLLRYIVLTKKQKNTINLANESNALKAKFISNISAQLEPTLQKLDSKQPEVKALLDFSSHIQTLSDIENAQSGNIELTNTSIPPYCEGLMDQIRSKVKKDVTLTVNTQKMSADINKEYVSHILLHLLTNAAKYTAEGGTICLEFKKRGPQSIQFLVSNTGENFVEQQREDIFKPFREIRDLTKGDGLGLPICKQMALKMNGDLEVDPQFTKGVRFVLNLHA